jgi:bisphosphoglycerate-independent phosphoglycerate mutase (AlkP superfamily)
MYWFKRKYRQIQRVIYFLPLIWKGYDFDYQYSIDLFKKQLERTANFLDSDKSYSMDAKQRASRIRTAIRLMDKVYEEEYGMEWMGKLKKLYGNNILDSCFEDTGKGNGSSYLVYEYEKWDNAKEITEIKWKLFKESKEKQKRAHKLLWRFIEHNIQHWWD